MNMLPIALTQNLKPHSICLILEGYEEEFYFTRLLDIRVFSDKYDIKLVNAKAQPNIPPKFQEVYASDRYEVVLVVCDMDRVPNEYTKMIAEIDKTLGEGKAEKITIYTRPCTLQVILSHFGEVRLSTQAKRNSQDDVLRLTGVTNYDAHQDQLQIICNKIFQRTYADMKRRVQQIGDDPSKIPSTNILKLFGWLESDDTSWITDINNLLGI